MTQIASFAFLRNKLLDRTSRPVLPGVAILAMAACSLPGPPPAEYVISAMPPATATTVSQKGWPIIEVKRVQLPDYLDTTDIVERRGNQLLPSSTGRWSERLSVGMTRALSASLAARLPKMLVTATTPVERPTRLLVVDVAAFEWREDRQVVLVARSTIINGANREILRSQQVSLVEETDGGSDGAIVAAMARAVDDLADQLAAGIDHDCQTC